MYVLQKKLMRIKLISMCIIFSVLHKNTQIHELFQAHDPIDDNISVVILNISFPHIKLPHARHIVFTHYQPSLFINILFFNITAR